MYRRSLEWGEAETEASLQASTISFSDTALAELLLAKWEKVLTVSHASSKTVRVEVVGVETTIFSWFE